MWSFNGNITGTVLSEQQKLPMLVEGFTLVPRTTGVTNVYKMTVGGQQVCIMPFNKTVNVGEIYQGTNQVVLLPTEQIKIVSAISVDYDFTISNIEAP